MAGSFSPVAYAAFLPDAFYFTVGAADTDVVDDSFNISKQSLCSWVQSKDNKFVFLNDELEFQVQNLTSEQLEQPECKFKIQIYTDCERGGGGGGGGGGGAAEKRTAAMLYVKNEGRNMVACCGSADAVSPEEMEVPSRIEEAQHRALFYMSRLTQSHAYQFESSAFPRRFLGFRPDGADPSLCRLLLLGKARDEVDEACQVVLCD